MRTISPELEGALKIFARFFDLIHQPITIINRQGRFVYYNRESAEIDGNPEPALGKHVLEVYTSLKEEKSTMLDSLKRGAEYIGNYQIYYNYRGRPVDYQHTTVPLYAEDGSIDGVIEIGRDMSNVRKLQQQVVELNRLLYSEPEPPENEIITCNPVMQGLIRKARKLALNNAPVVIVGETGTGKELFARLLHRSSRRAAKPLIALNCGALPVPLIESTLFGTVKGAFTGAENSKGYLEIADGGTLFLDELNAMPVEIQSKLLRFLQDKTFWKLGDSRQLRSDVRIIAAMNEPPAQLIEEKRLRPDLFYRLCVGVLSLPPLAARPEDIAPLARHFVAKHAEVANGTLHGISERALHALQQKAWPGNVRMLENVIVRSMTMQEQPGQLDTVVSDEEIFGPATLRQTATLPMPAPTAPAPAEAGGLAEQVAALERRLIVDALNRSGGNVSQAARLLALSRTTLNSKIGRYRIRLGVQDA